MKKLYILKNFTLVIIAIMAITGISANAQTNLIAGYDANKKTGTNSEENKWGCWACSYSGAIWKTAGGTDVRYQDAPASFFQSNGTTAYTGRTTMCRFDGSYTARSLGFL